MKRRNLLFVATVLGGTAAFAGFSTVNDHVRFEIDHAPPALRSAPPPPPPRGGDPDTFATGEVNVVSIIRTADERKAISPLIYGINEVTVRSPPADLLAGITWVRRGGDRSNTYNWETNVSNGGHWNHFSSDMYLATGLANPNAPAAIDLEIITRNRAAGRGTMVPFVLNDYVAGPVTANIPYDTVGFDRNLYFNRVGLVKPTPFTATPDLSDGMVYIDEHIQYLRNQIGQDIYAPGPTQVMIGTDNEPDLFAQNFPMLQVGGGENLFADNGVHIGNRVTGPEFTQRFITFAKRVKQLAPTAAIVGPDHYHFDGWTTWHHSMPQYRGRGSWYMDDFLATVRAESQATGRRLLDTWDFHWYPQRVFNGSFVWALDHSKRAMTAAEIDAVIQGPRSYWDNAYNEQSWITNDHLLGPAYIIQRLQDRIAMYYPGTKIGVSEYFPGGCAHISSGLATADTLGVFARMGVHLAAMWPGCSRLEYVFGAVKLLRNANGAGLRFADTVVKVEHPEKAQSLVYAGSDNAQRVTVLVINKTNAVRTFGIRAFHSARLTNVDAYRIDSANPNPLFAGTTTLTKNNAYAYQAPAMSATMLVFRTASAIAAHQAKAQARRARRATACSTSPQHSYSARSSWPTSGGSITSLGALRRMQVEPPHFSAPDSCAGLSAQSPSPRKPRRSSRLPRGDPRGHLAHDNSL